MSQPRADFEKAATANPPDFQTAFNNLNTLGMDEMVHALSAIGPKALGQIFDHRFAYAHGLDGPRMEYAMKVVKDRKLPVIAPGFLMSTGQVGTAASFLNVGAPTGPRFTLKILAVDTQSVTQPTVRPNNITQMKKILADQGNGFELDVSAHPTTLGIGDIKSQDSIDNLKALLDPIAVSTLDRLVIVFGDYLVPGERGSTRKTTSGRTFSIVDTSSMGPDNCTMIHETGHAAGLDHIEQEARKSRPVAVWDESNIMREAPTMGRNTITVGQGEVLSATFFAKQK